MSVSYAYTVKNEICGSDRFENACCRKAQLYGLVLFSAVYSDNAFKLTTGHIASALRCAALINELMGIELKVNILGNGYCVKADGATAKQIFEFMGHDEKEVALNINHVNFDCESCMSAFAAGAFLACGTVSSPDREYRLEFTSSHKKRLDDFRVVLEELEVAAHLTQRGNEYVLYTKDSECIENLLAYMGATTSALELMSTKVAKNIRNRANRHVNVETANLSRTLASSMKQVEAIEYLIEMDELYKLDGELSDIAALRLANPECSLTQLSKLANISRSVVNSRLKKLEEIAENLRERK